MRKVNSKANPIFRIAAILVCLTLITTYMMSGMYARYSTSTSGSDSARVAKFSVSDMLKQGDTVEDKIEISMLPGEEKVYTFTITNDSEVAVSYNVEVKNETGNLPLDIEFEGKKGTFAPGHQEKICTVTIKLPEKENDFLYHREIDYLTVTVHCEQID